MHFLPIPTFHLNYITWSFGVLFLVIIGSCEPGTTFDRQNDGLELVSVDLSKSRSGRLSEFFEPEVEYIWLEDDSEEAQLNSGLQKILFHRNKIYTLDIFGCKCIQIFDKSGKYLGEINAYGEGPGEYLDFDDTAIVNEELVLLGVYPFKMMWFSLEGKFLRELIFRDRVGPGVYAEFDHRYYLYTPTRDRGDFLVQSFNESMKDTVKYFPYDPHLLYGDDSGRTYFQKKQGQPLFWEDVSGHHLPIQ